MTSVVGWTGSRSSPSTSGFFSWTTATGLLRVRLPLRGWVRGLDRVPAELVAQRRVDRGREGVLATRGEALVQGGGDHRRGDALVDCVLHGPAPLAGVLHPRLEPLEVVALHLEGACGQLAQPGADHRSLHPQVRDLRVVELVLRGV